METNSTFEMCSFNLKILEKHEKTWDICDKVIWVQLQLHFINNFIVTFERIFPFTSVNINIAYLKLPYQMVV